LPQTLGKLDVLFLGLTAVVLGLLGVLWLGSWLEGITARTAAGVLIFLAAKANHRRRITNATSAEFGPPMLAASLMKFWPPGLCY
jgi:hypothetical protein